MLKPSLFVTFALIQSLALGSAAWAADEVGSVSAVGGEATAQQPGAEPRPLKCGDPVFAGDTLRTGSDSHVGVQLDDIATHLDANTQVVIGRTAESTPSARLLAGKVRMIDPRDGGAPAQLAALDADAHVKGNDAEAYIFSEKAGPYAMMCEWDAPLPVSRGSESKTAKPGECVIAKPKEPLYTANAHDQRIPALAQECGPGPALAFDPSHHLSPTDVAAAGPVADAFQPPPPPAGPEHPCEKGAVCSPTIPLVIAEPPPVIDPCPPGFCTTPQDATPPVQADGPPAPPIKDDGPPAPPVKDGGPPPVPFANDAPPPFANTPPAPPVQDVPVFTDTPPAPPVKDAPPYQPPPSFPPKA